MAPGNTKQHVDVIQPTLQLQRPSAKHIQHYWAGAFYVCTVLLSGSVRPG